MPATLRHPMSLSFQSPSRKSIVGGLSIVLRSHSTRLPIDSHVRLPPSVFLLQPPRKSAILPGSTLDHQRSQATKEDRSRLGWWPTARVTPLIFALSSQRANRKQFRSASRFPRLHRSAVLRCANLMERRNSACGGVGSDSQRSEGIETRYECTHTLISYCAAQANETLLTSTFRMRLRRDGDTVPAAELRR